jgi:3-hydroxybutyrate dehydrogenase
MSQSFAGTSVLVTGASQGIGRAIAAGFAAAGADLAILAEDDGIEAAAEAIGRQAGRPVRALRCDIADPGAVAGAIGRLPRIDVLVNNAGYQPLTPADDPDPAVDDAFRRVIDVNVTGTWLVTRRALPRMGRGGRIIMTGSIWGRTGAARYAGYTASKHAVIGLMRALAMELGPAGITVNAVCPGWVRTEGAMWTVRAEAVREGRPVEALLEDAMRHQPIAGIMEPEAMVPMYLFLASPAAADITGQVIGVDRGHFVG